MYEVEMKYFLGNNVEPIIEIINKYKWFKIDEIYQKDKYYTSKYKDFIESEECLRIRTTNSYVELTWKPPTSKEMNEKGQYWKEELDIDIKSIHEKVEKLLLVLDFIEYVEVEKRRLKFRINDFSIICLDKIEGLGWFIEIETMHDDENYALEQNETYANKLMLKTEDKVNIPYRDLVKKNGFA